MTQSDAISLTPDQANEQFCYLITTGRVTGRPHEVEMWFAVHPDGADMAALFCLAGGRERTDWVRNLRSTPVLQVRIGGTTYAARGAVIEGEAQEPLAREALAAKYYGWRGGGLPNDWARTALPVAITLVRELAEAHD